MRVVVDFELRSRVDLKKAGSWVYSRDPSTEPLVMSYTLDGRRARRWHPAFPHLGIEATGDPEDLFEAIEAGCVVEAHNAFFERAVWRNIMARRYGWPVPGGDQWRCTAAMAAAMSLPRDLDTLGAILRLRHRKDKRGKDLIRRYSKPRKPTKNNPAEWHEDREGYLEFFDYCDDDALSEWELGDALDPLPPDELEIWRMDQRMNLRGVRIDVEGVEAAINIVKDAVSAMNEELAELTDGTVTAASQRDRLRAWYNESLGPVTRKGGLLLPNTQAGTLDGMIGALASVPELWRQRRALQICRSANRTSTKKYAEMLRQADVDGRLRDLMIYSGAGPGRWTARGVQVHNLPRGFKKDMDRVWQDVRSGDYEWLETLYPDVMDTLSKALRGAFVATEGKELLVADFAAIEARVLFWLAGARAALQVLQGGGDIYCDMASDVYKRPVNKDDHPNERQMGKQAILGLGYGMGPPKFVVTLAGYGIAVEEEFADGVVSIYRTKYREVPDLWNACNAAAMGAVREYHRVLEEHGATVEDGLQGPEIHAGPRLSYFCRGRFLLCRLPSGRCVYYCDPKIGMRPTPWGARQPALTYMSVDQKTRKWMRTDTYGAKLVENATQATARDLMAAAMVRAERTEAVDVLMSVHDEGVFEAPKGTFTAADVEELMAECPPWGEGCPVAAEGFVARRYRKG